ncbi:MAG: TIGR04219 family outer membrane beta-barrel protein [Cellvibrionaceae bacterium]
MIKPLNYRGFFDPLGGIMQNRITLATLALALSATTFTAHADTFLGIRAGAGMWNPTTSGSVGPDAIDMENELGIDKENQNYYYASIEHPVPLVPNIRLQHTELDVTGTGELDVAARLDDLAFTPDIPVTTSIDLSHTDLTLYYEILDNVVEADVGLTFRQFDSTLTMTTALETESVTVDGVIPMIHLGAAVNLPFTGLSVAATIDALSYDDYTMSDTKAEITFETEFTPVITLNLKAGYRILELELDEADDVTADIEFDGPYAGIELYF